MPLCYQVMLPIDDFDIIIYILGFYIYIAIVYGE